MSTIEQRLWGRTRRTEKGCWEFTGCCVSRVGYGRIQYNSKVRWAHRVAWEVANGSIPAGMHVLHSCDNPPCVNPEHLRLGTHADNMADKAAKGRCNIPRGAANHEAKLSDQDVLDIRAARAKGEQYKAIAQRYGINPLYASRVARGLKRAD